MYESGEQKNTLNKAEKKTDIDGDFLVPFTPHAQRTQSDLAVFPVHKVESLVVTFAATQRDHDNQPKNQNWSETYFKVRSWEPTLYTMLGVTYFKKYVPTGGTFWNRKAGRKKEDLKSNEGLRTLINRTYQLEMLHLAGIILVYGVAFFSGWPALVHLGLQIAVNIYPIMLQRYNRALAIEKLSQI